MFRQFSHRRRLTAIILHLLVLFLSSSTALPLSELDSAASDWGLSLSSGGVFTAKALPVSNATATNTTAQYIPYVRGLDTGLAGAALILFTGTYYLLIQHATAFVSVSKLPSLPFQENLQSLLTKTWPESYVSDATGVSLPRTFQRWNLVRLSNHIDRFERVGYTLNGVKQSEQTTQKFPPSSLVWTRNESSAIQRAVQIAIWEWVSLWLVAIMVVNTAVYNGFITGEGNPDRYPRLALMLIYGVAFLIHFCYTWVCFCGALSCIVRNGCWTMLGSVRFAVSTKDMRGISVPKYERAMGPHVRLFDASILGPTRILGDYAIVSDNGRLIARRNTITQQENTPILSMQESEIKRIESAVEAALERVILNATIMLSISVVTGFSTWTQSQLNNATSTQLGSLALLASVASGIGAMLSSALHLGNMKSSTWRFLRITELIICDQSQPETETPHIGFTYEDGIGKTGKEKYRPMTLLDLFRATTLSQIPFASIFGPAYVLLPPSQRFSRESPQWSFTLRLKLGDSRVTFTTKQSQFGSAPDVNNPLTAAVFLEVDETPEQDAKRKGTAVEEPPLGHAKSSDDRACVTVESHRERTNCIDS